MIIHLSLMYLAQLKKLLETDFWEMRPLQLLVFILIDFLLLLNVFGAVQSLTIEINSGCIELDGTLRLADHLQAWQTPSWADQEQYQS